MRNIYFLRVNKIILLDFRLAIDDFFPFNRTDADLIILNDVNT